MESRFRLIFAALMLVLLAAPAYAQEQPGPVAIRLHEGRLTMNLNAAPLGRVLQEIGARTGIRITAAESLAADPVSLASKDLPADEALRKLLAPYDAFFLYAAAGDGSSRLRSVWVYPRGEAAALVPVPPEKWAGARDLETSLGDADPSVRERGYEALMARPETRSRELVLRALRGDTEKDDAVRQRLLSSAIAKMPLPTELLMELARTDSSEEIRVTALDALAGDPAVRQLAESALTDPAEIVRQRAAEIMAALDLASQSRDPAQREPENQP